MIITQLLPAQSENFRKESDRLFQFLHAPVERGEVVHATKCLRVVETKLGFHESQCCFEERQGVGESPCISIRPSQVLHGLESLGMVGLKSYLHKLERLFEQWKRFGPSTRSQIHYGQVIHAVERKRMVET